MVNEDKWEALFGFSKTVPDGEIDQQQCDLAYAIQQVTEEIILKMAKEAVKVTERAPFYPDYLRMRLNPGIFRTLIRKSRVQRYIRHPEFLGIQPTKMFSSLLGSNSENGDEGEPDFENNINTEEAFENKDQIELATDYTIGKIRKENPDKRIIFILDAPRQNIYDGGSLESSGSYWIHELMHRVTAKYNVEFIDLGPLMESDYRENGRLFNSDVELALERIRSSVCS